MVVIRHHFVTKESIVNHRLNQFWELKMVNSTIEIDVVNMSAQTTRSGTYTMKVPFSSLSRTMQFIHRSGGKVIDVKNPGTIAEPIATSVDRSSANEASVSANQTAQRVAQDRSKQSGKQTKK
jgi:CpcD/allophycocyanin linker domain